MSPRQELWALACALGPRVAGQLRLMTRLMVRRGQHADRRRAGSAVPAGLRRWWQFATGVEPAAGIPAEVGGAPGATLLGAEG